MKFAFLYHFLIILISSLKYTRKGHFFHLQLTSVEPSSLYRVDTRLESN